MDPYEEPVVAATPGPEPGDPTMPGERPETADGLGAGGTVRRTPI